MRTPRLLPLALLTAALAALAACGPPSAPSLAATSALTVRCTGAPGERVELTLNGRSVALTTPSGEPCSVGTLAVERESDASPPLELERDGGLACAWIADLDTDGREELLLVIRGAGSGGFLQLVLLRDGPGDFDVHQLPAPDGASLEGYRRGGGIEVRGSESVLTYLRYGEGLGLVDDPLGAVADGESPVRFEDDSGADPRGGLREAVLDLAIGAWREGRP